MPHHISVLYASLEVNKKQHWFCGKTFVSQLQPICGTGALGVTLFVSELFSFTEFFLIFFSNLEGDVDKLELGMEVEYNLGTRGSQGSCMAAENVRVLPKGTIEAPPCTGPPVEGTVLRPLRCVNPEQAEYAGLVQASEGISMT